MQTPQNLVIRSATRADRTALEQLEKRAFDSDRLSPRSLRRLVDTAHALRLVGETAGQIVVDAFVLLRGRTSLARLYSLAVDPEWRGRGFGRTMLDAVEAAVTEAGRSVLRLEVREDNAVARALYTGAGYREIGRRADYYADGCAAIRMEKTLRPVPTPVVSTVPFYAQTLAFTCGPACLMMAMAALGWREPCDRVRELRIWREATLVFMAGGHAGCEPYGLAAAARRRDFAAEVWITGDAPLFVETVRDPDKRDVIALVQHDHRETALGLGAVTGPGLVSLERLSFALEDGCVPLVLISSYRLYGVREPHWIVVTGVDTRFVYIHDPYIDRTHGRSGIDATHIPVARTEFERMTRFGRARRQAACIIGPVGTLWRAS